MAQFGRDQWRAQGETFTVWFRTLNRLAPLGVAAAPAAGPRTRTPTPSTRPSSSAARSRPGCSARRGRSPRIALVAFGAASIIFDGLSQTVAFASVFGDPALVQKTLILLVFLGVIVAGRARGRRGW